jgi:hypothetical protein
MIDMHAHVFNAAYLPLQGIFQSRGVPRAVARPLARLLQDAVQRDGALPSLRARSLFRSPARAAPADADASAAWDALLITGADPATIFAQEAETSFVESHEADIEEALAALEQEFPEEALESLAPFAVSAAAEATVEVDLASRPAGNLRVRLRRLLLWVARIIVDGLALIGWILLLLSRESNIARELFETYPEADLFVHHMMDMDPHYPPGRSSYPFMDLQLRRMRALAETSHGRLLTFVAYSPFRDESIDVVEEWLHRGCAGVKFYPPSGYRPVGNTAAELDGTGQNPAQVDGRNLDLFRLCVQYDVPIFAHCQPGEMEQNPKKRTGCYSNPQGWERVLDTPGLEKLRLCLGHAGGEGWTAPPGREDDEGVARCGGARFVSGVVSLCVRYPNVYCEFGCLDGIFERGGRANFAARLAGYIQQNPGFAHKVLYGSDWHMLAKTPAPGRYDDAFREAFRAHATLAPIEDRFFRRNALDYLNLGGFLNRSRGRISRREEDHLRRVMNAA